MVLVLASSSPRRRVLMEEAGYVFEVRKPMVSETGYRPTELAVVENARRKAENVVGAEQELVIGADTMVECGDELLGKPVDKKDAERMLRLQLACPTTIFTGISVIDTAGPSEVHGWEVSSVRMDGDEKGIRGYLDSGLWKGKAGAFGIQDEAMITIDLLWGGTDNVVGMPMTLLRRLLGTLDHGENGSR